MNDDAALARKEIRQAIVALRDLMNEATYLRDVRPGVEAIFDAFELYMLGDEEAEAEG